MSDRVPKKFGKCVVMKELARGSTALVYLARHEGLGIRVAVKVLRKKLPEEKPEYATRFLREARMAARLEHPNLVRVIDCGIEEGFHYMVMDYVDGQDCLEVLRERGQGLPWRRTTEIILQAAAGLSHAAENDVIHRDVKPGNIMIDHSGRVRVTDLGLAKPVAKGVKELTQELHTVGTPNYMSPEQIRHPRGLDQRADIYSLGASFYHIVTGRPPYIGDNPMDVVTRHLTEALVPPHKVKPGLPVAVSKVVCKMMAKSPDDRYQDYDTLCRELENLLEGKKVSSESAEQPGPSEEEREENFAVLKQLREFGKFEIERDEEETSEAVRTPVEHAETRATPSLSPFNRADHKVTGAPAEAEAEPTRAERAAQGGLTGLLVALIVIGLIAVLAVALFAALAAG